MSKGHQTIRPETVTEKIIEALKIQAYNSRDLQTITQFDQDTIIFALQSLLENDTISIQSNNLYSLK
jgi:hypothetical protein